MKKEEESLVSLALFFFLHLFWFSSLFSSSSVSSTNAESMRDLSDGVFLLKTRYAEGVAFSVENTSKTPVRLDLKLSDVQSKPIEEPKKQNKITTIKKKKNEEGRKRDAEPRRRTHSSQILDWREGRLI